MRGYLARLLRAGAARPALLVRWLDVGGGTGVLRLSEDNGLLAVPLRERPPTARRRLDDPERV